MAKLKHWISIRICAVILTLFLIHTQVIGQSKLMRAEKREFLLSTEIPAEHIDPASIDLTGLVNTLVNASQPDSQQLFSLLSVTSHSSLSLHKLTLLVYNISDFQDIESSLFPLRYCYCLTNKTNDLTDFTAILLDVMGNSTSYLQELFKSSSILSVSQKNSSDCIYICVMAGKSDSDLSQLWDMGSVRPLFNQTITEEIPRGNLTFPLLPFVVWHDLSNTSDLVLWPKPSTDSYRTASTESHKSRVPTAPMTSSPLIKSSAAPQTTVTVTTTPTAVITQSKADTTTTQPTKTRHAATTTTATHTIAPTVTTAISLPTQRQTTTTSIQQLTKVSHTEKPGCPWRIELFHQRIEKEDLKETLEEELIWGRATISSVKLQPCVFELCKFYSQCVCRGFSHRAAALQRYCVDSHHWYERHTAEVCSRMRRLTFSRNLKQKCLARMCVKM
ncbi:HERV-H LTR-associating protein 1 isoform X2 [Labeo rohita]|uniref:HERV-H LTR-associating protein 1 isoform X2 n=1 Tax=Labeo rohita TaxID=84645 RepID=UPI0021E202C2|nr:HERV-H LTR-associating protein 1 isoform X2 [Labeo rohita]